MAKGLRSKVLRRYRTAKRQVVDAKVETKRSITLFNKMAKLCRGEQVDFIPPPNMFVHPELPIAEIPQKLPEQPIDFRAEAVPSAGLAFKGNRRKFSKDEIENSSLLQSLIQKDNIINDLNMDQTTNITSTERSGVKKKFKGNTITAKKYNKPISKKR